MTGRVDPWGASFLAIEFNFWGRESLFPTAEPPRPPIAVKSLSAQVNNFQKVPFLSFYQRISKFYMTVLLCRKFCKYFKEMETKKTLSEND